MELLLVLATILVAATLAWRAAGPQLPARADRRGAGDDEDRPGDAADHVR